MPAISDRLYTAAAVRRLDALAISGEAGDGYTLMCRAGQAVVDAARDTFPGARRWLVLCGAGNNAGDGYVIARLASALGLDVQLVYLCPPEQLGGEAGQAVADWREAGGQAESWAGELPATDLVIDALLGTGLDRDVSGDWAAAIDAANHLDATRVAVDIPTGLGADTGAILGTTFNADLTVTFIGQKRGLFTADGPDKAGRVVLDRLGISRKVHDTLAAEIAETANASATAAMAAGERLGRDTLAALLPPRPLNSHKGQFGHVFVVGGNRGMSGAARLAGEAALRAGAGRVTVATHPAHAHWLNLTRPELMTRAVEADDDIPRQEAGNDVIAVGPGLGRDGWARSVLPACMKATGPLVVDADGLNLLAMLADQVGMPACGQWVMTPHPAEAARLLGQSTQQVQADRFTAAAALAQRYGAIVVLKGCGTIIAAPDGRWAVCPLGNPAMATAGSGDVLTGVVAAMLAQGLAPWEAACCAVVAHAAAGDAAAASGSRGRLASDFCAALPGVLDD